MQQILWLIVWVLAIPLILYNSVLFLTLLALKHPQKGAVMRSAWSEVWLLGLLANLGGGFWMFLRVPVSVFRPGFFTHTVEIVWMVIGVAVTGACLLFVEKQALSTGGLLDIREQRIAALALAVIGAPYFFVAPLSM